jgi:hypothetical protein
MVAENRLQVHLACTRPRLRLVAPIVLGDGCITVSRSLGDVGKPRCFSRSGLTGFKSRLLQPAGRSNGGLGSVRAPSSVQNNWSSGHKHCFFQRGRVARSQLRCIRSFRWVHRGAAGIGMGLCWLTPPSAHPAVDIRC